MTSSAPRRPTPLMTLPLRRVAFPAFMLAACRTEHEESDSMPAYRAYRQPCATTNCPV